MRIDCNNIDEALREEEPELKRALSHHAGACATCRERIRLWQEMSDAAGTMRRHWDSPDLWRRIELALAAERRTAQLRKTGRFLALFTPTENRWLSLAAAAGFVIVSLSVAFVLLRSVQTPDAHLVRRDPEFEKQILTDKALKEIERSETAYIQSIDRLSRLVEPGLAKASTPLMLSYREKLLLLDSAIAECRANIDRNRFNSYLRRELLSIYQEKQRTLQELLKEN